MLAPERFILENTLPMAECRSQQLFLIRSLECATPESQATMFEVPFEPMDQGIHVHHLSPRRPDLECSQPLYSFSPGPDYIERDDYFGDWASLVCTQNHDKGKGKSVERPISPIEGPSIRPMDILLSSPGSCYSCAAVSPYSFKGLGSLYHQPNIPLSADTLTNSDPFYNGEALYGIPEIAAPFDTASMAQRQGEDTIRIEIPAKFGTQVCERMFKGMKDVFKTSCYEIHSKTQEPQCIHTLFRSLTSSEELKHTMKESLSTAPTTPRTSVPSLEFYVRGDGGNKRKWSQIDLVHKDSLASDLTSIDEFYDNDEHENENSKTKETPSELSTPMSFRKLNKKARDTVTSMFGSPSITNYSRSHSETWRESSPFQIREKKRSRRTVEVPQGNYGDVCLKPLPMERARRRLNSASGGAKDVVFVAKEVAMALPKAVSGWRKK